MMSRRSITYLRQKPRSRPSKPSKLFEFADIGESEPQETRDSSEIVNSRERFQTSRSHRPSRPSTSSKTPRSTSILDQIFGEPIPNDTFGLATPYITTESPMAQCPTDIKGVHAVFMERVYEKQTIHNTSMIHGCKDFYGYYFPPWSYMSSGRKSRPALICLYGKGSQYNGVTYPGKFSEQLSRNPMDYASWRKKIKLMVRDCFWKVYQDSDRFADGTYLFRMTRYPTNPELLRFEIQNMLTKVYEQMDFFSGIRSGTDYSQSVLLDTRLNASLKERHYPPPISESEEKWRKVFLRDRMKTRERRTAGEGETTGEGGTAEGVTSTGELRTAREAISAGAVTSTGKVTSMGEAKNVKEARSTEEAKFSAEKNMKEKQEGKS